MAKRKDHHWALFDEEWNYKGGIITSGDPPVEDEVSGFKVVKVNRFPQHYETWDPKSGSWKQDLKEKHRVEALIEASEGRRRGELDLPDEQTQRWAYALLGKLGLKISQEVKAEFFPFITQDDEPRGVKRPKKLGRPRL